MSSTTTAHCPHCDARLQITSRKLDGKQVTCPRCSGHFVIERDTHHGRYVGVIFLDDLREEMLTVDAAAGAAPSLRSTPANTVTYCRQQGGRLALYRSGFRLLTLGVALAAWTMTCTHRRALANDCRCWQTSDVVRLQNPFACYDLWA